MYNKLFKTCIFLFNFKHPDGVITHLVERFQSTHLFVILTVWKQSVKVDFNCKCGLIVFMGCSLKCINASFRKKNIIFT